MINNYNNSPSLPRRLTATVLLATGALLGASCSTGIEDTPSKQAPTAESLADEVLAQSTDVAGNVFDRANSKLAKASELLLEQLKVSDGTPEVGDYTPDENAVFNFNVQRDSINEEFGKKIVDLYDRDIGDNSAIYSPEDETTRYYVDIKPYGESAGLSFLAVYFDDKPIQINTSQYGYDEEGLEETYLSTGSTLDYVTAGDGDNVISIKNVNSENSGQSVLAEYHDVTERVIDSAG